MRRALPLLLLLLAAACAPPPAPTPPRPGPGPLGATGIAISQLPIGTTLVGTEAAPVVQSGATVQTTAAAIAASFAISDVTRALPYTLGAADVGGNVPLTGAGNLTINAAVIPANKAACYTNANATGGGLITIAGSASIHNLPGTAFGPHGGGCLIGRLDGTYDWSPGAVGDDVEDQLVTGGANVTPKNLGTISSGTTTLDCGARPLQYLTNNGAFTLAAPTSDGSCLVRMTNGASAGAISFSGFTVGSSTGDALDTVNGHIFTLSVWRINTSSGYRVAAQQ